MSLDTVTACEVLECNFAEPACGYPKSGPPNYPFDPAHPFGIAPAHRRGQPGLLALRLPHLAADRRARPRCSPSVIGVIVGLVAGFAGGVVDKVLSFIIDLFLTIPFLLAALTIAPIINDRFGTSDSYETIQIGSLVADPVDLRLDGRGAPDPRRGALPARA